VLEQFNQLTGETSRVPLETNRVSLRAHCDFLKEKATFSYSTNGQTFEPLGGEFTMIFQLKTFQGVRYSLFHYTQEDAPGGHADFDAFTVDEPHPRGLMRPIPYGQTIALKGFGEGLPLTVGGESRFKVVDRGSGRVALQTERGLVSVTSSDSRNRVALTTGNPTDAETFQWTENVFGDLILLSLATHRHLRVDPDSRAVTADHPGPKPDRKDGSCFVWEVTSPY
jgi:hypothetical protein